MIPFFFTTYKKAPLATVISFLASMCFLGTLFLTVGYFLNWSDVKSEMTLGESLLFAGILAVIGFLLKKLAESMARHKQRKLAEKAAAAAPIGYTQPPAAAPQRAAETRSARRFCPMCGAPTGPEDQFCRNCGAKL